MTYEIKRKLITFLSNKLRKIYYETTDDKPRLNIFQIKTEKGFDSNVIENHGYYENGYNFFNDNGCQCFLMFGDGAKKKKVISIAIDDIGSNGWYGTIGMLYRCIDEIDDIATEFRQLRSNLEKQEKIDNIAKNSIYTWLKTIMHNQPYSYYTTEEKHKITLSIKIKNRMQLDVPIYFKKFQKIMPHLAEAIQQFENTVNQSKIKVLIGNSQPEQKWTTLHN